MNPLKALVHAAGGWYVNRICQSEAEAQQFRRHNERPVEYGFALAALAQERPRSVLDVGTGTTSWPALLRDCGFSVTAIDNVRDYWPAGMTNRHWQVEDVDVTKPVGFDRKFDAVTCISVIEHIEDHVSAMRNMLNMLRPGGMLVVTTPYSHHHFDMNVYVRPDAAPGDPVPYKCRSSSADTLRQWLDLGVTLERRELWRMFSGPVWFTGERIAWSRAANEDEPHQLGLFVFRKAA